MKNKYSKSVILRCITCGDTSLEYNEDKTTITCKRCGREYPGGYDELVVLNQHEIDEELEKLGKEVMKDGKAYFDKMMKEMNRKNR